MQKISPMKLNFISNITRRHFEGRPLRVKHKKDWGRRFILLIPRTAVLFGSDAGNDGVKSASRSVI